MRTSGRHIVNLMMPSDVVTYSLPTHPYHTQHVGLVDLGVGVGRVLAPPLHLPLKLPLRINIIYRILLAKRSWVLFHNSVFCYTGRLPSVSLVPRLHLHFSMHAQVTHVGPYTRVGRVADHENYVWANAILSACVRHRENYDDNDDD